MCSQMRKVAIYRMYGFLVFSLMARTAVSEIWRRLLKLSFFEGACLHDLKVCARTASLASHMDISNIDTQHTGQDPYLLKRAPSRCSSFIVIPINAANVTKFSSVSPTGCPVADFLGFFTTPLSSAKNSSGSASPSSAAAFVRFFAERMPSNEIQRSANVESVVAALVSLSSRSTPDSCH